MPGRGLVQQPTTRLFSIAKTSTGAAANELYEGSEDVLRDDPERAQGGRSNLRRTRAVIDLEPFVARSGSSDAHQTAKSRRRERHAVRPVGDDDMFKELLPTPEHTGVIHDPRRERTLGRPCARNKSMYNLSLQAFSATRPAALSIGRMELITLRYLFRACELAELCGTDRPV